MGGGGGGGDGGASERAAEEARKAELRARIGAMFGEAPTSPVMTRQTTTVPAVIQPRTLQEESINRDRVKRAGGGAVDIPAALPPQTITTEVPLDLSADVNTAKGMFEQEESNLSNTLRAFYTDQLKRQFEQASRAVKFGAANTGNLGGSAYADAVAKLNEENALGGTRVEEAVRRSINNLRAQREDSRNRAIGLVNAGSGDEAVASARTGLQQALSNANAAQRENIVMDLFGNLAFAKVASDQNSRNAQLAELYRRPGAFFPTQPTAGGTIVPTRF
jgi:hypothetical protein